MTTTSNRGTYVDTWPGGRVWRRSDGKHVYVIRRMIGGKRYTASTHCTSLSSAMKQLDRFMANPEAYDPRGEAPPEPIYLKVEIRDGKVFANKLAEEFLAFSKNEKGNTREWLGKQARALAWWSKRLGNIDLRRVTLRDHILPALEGATSRHHRIAVLKNLYGWLRTEAHLLTTAEDPVYGQLKVPQVHVAQLTKSKVIPREHIDLVLEHLTSPWRDALIVQSGTGMHVTELQRFGAAGTVEPLPKHAEQEGVAGVLVIPLHKSGAPHRVRVSTEVLAAASRLRAHGSISRKWYNEAIAAACAAVKRPDGQVGIPAFTPGRLRHSVATWAIEEGADPASVSAFLGHRSPATTRKFYATHASVAKVPTLH
jgi:integrase